MKHENTELKQSMNMKWIKGESGTTYICPIGALEGIENPTEGDLKRLCMDESSNPHND